MRRALIAFPFVVLSYTAWLWWLGFDRGPGGREGLAEAAALVVLGGSSALIGFCKCQCWQLWRFLVGGLLGGALCALPFVADHRSALSLMAVCALLGVIHGALFWLLAVWRNRDLSCPAFFHLPDGARYPVAKHLRLKVQ